LRPGSSVANRALELLGKGLGTFVDCEPAKAPRLEDLSTEGLERMLVDAVAEGDGPIDGPTN